MHSFGDSLAGKTRAACRARDLAPRVSLLVLRHLRQDTIIIHCKTNTSLTKIKVNNLTVLSATMRAFFLHKNRPRTIFSNCSSQKLLKYRVIFAKQMKLDNHREKSNRTSTSGNSLLIK